VRLHSVVNGRATTLLLRDVAFVPEAAENLLSPNQLLSDGIDWHIEHSTGLCTASVGGKVLFEARLCGGLHRLTPEPAAAFLATTSKETAALWHRRMGHLGYGSLAALRELVTGITTPAADFHAAAADLCAPCAQARQSRLPYESSSNRALVPLERVHMDVCGPISPAARNGARCFVTLLDDFSGFAMALPLKDKGQVAAAVQEALLLLERQTGHPIKQLRTDRGTEFLNAEMRSFCSQRGIIHQTSVPYTPQQNGAAERLNRTLEERMRALLLEAQLPHDLWAEALLTATYLRNLSPTRNNTATPRELLFGRKPEVGHLRVFGSRCFVRIPEQQRRSKLDPVSVGGRLLGYPQHSKGYRVLLQDGRIIESRDVLIDEGDSPVAGPATPHFTTVGDDEVQQPAAATQPAAAAATPAAEQQQGAAASPLQAAESTPTASPQPGAVQSEQGAQDSSDEEAAIGSAQGAPPEAAGAQGAPRTQEQGSTMPRRTTRSNAGVPPKRFALAAAADPPSDPTTYTQAMQSPEAEMWRQAMNEELASLLEHGTWLLEQPPPGVRPLSCKWVFQTKRDARGNIERYKARLVVRGFQQREGVDYNDVFAPVSKYTTLRTLLALAAAEDWELQQLDVKTAFLNGELDETIYMQQPPGFDDGSGTTCRLLKSLYGLKQAPRAWYHKLKGQLETMGFTASIADAGLYTKVMAGGSRVFVLVYVDDILVAGPQLSAVNVVKEQLATAFDVRDLGDARMFLGIEIERDRGARTLRVSQRQAVMDLLKRHSMSVCKPRTTPLAPSVQLLRATESDERVSGFAEIVGSLLYLANCTRPDIAFAVSALSRHMANPTRVHYNAAKSVLRYLSGTAGLGIEYGRVGGFEGWCDADFAGDLATRRSTTGFVFLLSGGAISWQSKLQPTVAASTTEAEYMAASSAVREGLWFRQLLADFGVSVGVVQMFGDNQAALTLVSNPVITARSKHIDVMHHFVRERVLRGEVSFSYCPTTEQVADCLTKSLSPTLFSACCVGMGMH
jgi:transposase InsO family protein